MLTVVLTGLYVRSPSARRAPETPAVTLTIGEPRTINLVFDSRAPRSPTSSSRSICRPASSWRDACRANAASWREAALTAGDNALPLTLVARAGRGGQLAARLRHGDDQKVFVVDVTVAQP